MSSRPRTTSNINNFQCSQWGGCSFISLSEAIALWNIFTTVCSVWGINGSFGHYLFSAFLVEICCWCQIHTICEKWLLVVDDLMSDIRLITNICFSSALRELLEWNWHSGIQWNPYGLVINNLVKTELFHSVQSAVVYLLQYCITALLNFIFYFFYLFRLICPEISLIIQHYIYMLCYYRYLENT